MHGAYTVIVRYHLREDGERSYSTTVACLADESQPKKKADAIAEAVRRLSLRPDVGAFCIISVVAERLELDDVISAYMYAKFNKKS